MIKKTIYILLAILISMTYALGVYIQHKESKKCDEKIVLTNNITILGSNVKYDEGMAIIKTCGGQKIEIPILNIKIVKKL